MIVVDQRTDAEKLSELLHQVEQEALDYKSETDLPFGKNEKHRLDFVKDAVAMSNRPKGGYILFGVTDAGEPCQPSGSCMNRKIFDGANLSGIVRAYVDGEVRVITQWHEVGSNEILLAYVSGHRDGLPLPMTSIGQYPDPHNAGKFKVAFYEGQIFLREGAGNVLLRHAHWTGALDAYAARIRDEARASVDDLVARLAAYPRSGPSGPTALLLEMPLSAFGEAVYANLEGSHHVTLRKFIIHAEQMIVEGGDSFEEALDHITVLVLQSLLWEHDESARRGVDALFQAFGRFGTSFEAAQSRWAMLTRLYVIGSLAVRMQAWLFLHDLVLRRVDSPGFSDYFYSSWLRQAQVEASRANLFKDLERSGLMISLARDLMQHQPMFRPDLSDSVLGNPEHLDQHDILLNSLAQFDLLYCLIVLAEGKDHGGAYPASSALSQQRVEPATDLVVTDEEVRAKLFNEATDQQIAQAFVEIWQLASQQAMQTSGNWWRPPDRVQRFIETVSQSDAV